MLICKGSRSPLCARTCKGSSEGSDLRVVPLASPASPTYTPVVLLLLLLLLLLLSLAGMLLRVDVLPRSEGMKGVLYIVWVGELLLVSHRLLLHHVRVHVHLLLLHVPQKRILL